MKQIYVAAAALGLSAAAYAQHSTFMKADLQVFDAGDSTWKDAVSVTPGTSVSLRILTTFDLASGVYDSWGGQSFNQIDVTSTAAGDLAQSFAGKINPGTQTFKLYNPGLATAKLDRLDNPSGSIQLGQLPSGSGGDQSNPLVTLTFTFTLDPLVDLARDVSFNVTSANFSLAQIFTTAGGTNVIVPPAARTWDGAVIHVVPAPGALALLGLGGWAASRRRR